jgi:membrane protease YdiL (CAAX protease family)
MGVALFGVIVLVFFLVQSGVFIRNVMNMTPEYQGRGFSFMLVNEPHFQERMMALGTNGDALAPAALWSGLAGLVLIVASVVLWKRGRTARFLGLQLPHWRPALIWTGAFLLLGLAIEGAARLSPIFRTDFMQQVLATITDTAPLVLGVGIMAPLFEEFLLRGLLFGSMRHLLDEHTSVAITAGVFALMHMQYSVAIILLILPMGVVLGYARARSGSIWVPVALHMLNNLVTVFLG